MSKSIKINAISKTLMSILNILFPLLTAPYIARILNVDGFTEYNRAQSMLTWFSPFAIFGVYTYGMRTMSQIKTDKKAVSKLFTKLFVLNVIICITVSIIYLIIVTLGRTFSEYKDIYIVMSLQLLFVCFATDWANEAFESYGFILIKTFFCRLIYVVLVFILVKKQEDLLIYVLLTSLSVMLNNILTFTYVKAHISFIKIKIRELQNLLKPLFIVFLLVNSSMLYTILDKFILTLLGSKLDLTYYNISQTITMAIINVTSSIILVSVPRLSNLWSINKKEEYRDILKKTSTAFLAIHTPCCIGVAALSNELMFFYAGEKYINGWIVLLCFAIRYYISGFDMIMAKQVLLATGKETLLTKIYYVGGIFNLTTKIFLYIFNLLTPELCIITTLMADVLVIFLEVIQSRKLFSEFNVLNKNNIRYLIISLLFIPVTCICRVNFDISTIQGRSFFTILSIIISIIIYSIMLIIAKDDFVRNIPIVSKIIRKTGNEK